ncbi:saccharopine dehydrogenase NADP-binding domain-containing protein [Microbulbifer bruguierae]|uniref:Saccharopine dehydrogenase NADP-binding domain-containing protein n=1 Tax=Microbulbifer bruguierae TaxID=3029061 RepID=A0ABY8NJB1_9GAMM|nr:saccharopine dehydrogenase NADP-binding domain-containing protein [Microbulbifer bruguierae]WGL17807.1 saccharopine dehydrogenase NADP-binding domain-containing protein [Microbulbifer bruguierae]
MNNKQILIYGAYGYTGELIARKAVAKGLRPILAGRSSSKLEPLATELGLPAIAVGLDDEETLKRTLQGVSVVIHCAGPFSATAEPMMRACIASGAHYQDITGEMAVYQQAHALDAEAKAANVVLCPGTGFDVIPTDCLAAALHREMTSATHLTLGFDSDSGLSPGTAKTSIESLGVGGAIRRNGKIEVIPHAELTRKINFGRGEKFAVAIPWGDVATAYYSTEIPNIEVYIPMSPRRAKKMKGLNKFRWLLRMNWMQQWLKGKVDKSVRGPTENQRAEQKTWVWGEVRNDRRGERRVGRVVTANGYDVTVNGSLAVMEFLLAYHGEGGYFTPSKLCGPELVEKLPGSGAIKIGID